MCEVPAQFPHRAQCLRSLLRCHHRVRAAGPQACHSLCLRVTQHRLILDDPLALAQSPFLVHGSLHPCPHSISSYRKASSQVHEPVVHCWFRKGRFYHRSLLSLLLLRKLFLLFGTYFRKGSEYFGRVRKLVSERFRSFRKTSVQLQKGSERLSEDGFVLL